MMEPRRLLVVTGAGGYIGRHLCASALRAGWDVLALGRRRPPSLEVRFAHYDLSRPRAVEIPAGAAAIIHLAADTQNADPELQRELAALQALVEAGANAGARLVLVSSQAAAPDAPTGYGRVKAALEQVALSAGGVVVRPGMVYGGEEAGLFGRLCTLIRCLPVIPVPWPSPRIQPIHVDDLAIALLNAAGSSAGPRLFKVAEARPIAFTSYLQAIARYRVRRARLFIPIPTVIVVPVIGVVSRVLKSPSLDPRRLLSLLHLRGMETRADNAALGVMPRSLSLGMQEVEARRRDLIREGRTLLAYFLSSSPPASMTARYVRAVERIDGGTALRLRAPLLVCPALLIIVEGPRILRETEFHLQRRLDIAFQLCEASRNTLPFMLDRQIGPVLVVLLTLGIALQETAARALRSTIGRLLYCHPVESEQP